MKNRLSTQFFFTAFFSFMIVHIYSAQGECTLGEKVDDMQSLKKPVLLNSKIGTEAVHDAGYSIHEVELSGTSLKEFVLPNGTVFAVTWRGLKHPDLSYVLGNYNTEYEKLKSTKVKTLGRSPIYVNSSKISVRMSGHMRDLHGQAYDPTLLPPNFSLLDLK